MGMHDRDWYREEYFAKKCQKAPHQRNQAAQSVNDFLRHERVKKQPPKAQKKLSPDVDAWRSVEKKMNLLKGLLWGAFAAAITAVFAAAVLAGLVSM